MRGNFEDKFSGVTYRPYSKLYLILICELSIAASLVCTNTPIIKQSEQYRPATITITITTTIIQTTTITAIVVIDYINHSRVMFLYYEW